MRLLHSPSPTTGTARRRLGTRAAAAALAAGLTVLSSACSDSQSTAADSTRAGDEARRSAADTARSAGGQGASFDQIQLSLSPVASLDQPLAMTQRPGSDDLWIAERVGRVRRIERTIRDSSADPRLETVRLITRPALDITGQVGTGGEGGLLGIAFSPDGSHLYTHFTGRNGDSAIVGYPMDEAGGVPRADPERSRVLLTVDQPYRNHNGGGLLFGPDGMLYVTLGDGGGSGDPERTGQDPTDVLGSILRIDPTPAGAAAYAIPPDNPFAPGTGTGAARPEVWIWGVRNPWRISFDQANGDLWVADVGQNSQEEIDRLPATDGWGKGANLGWNLMEGDESFAGDPPPGYVAPIITYGHDNQRCSVTGGYVYRGRAAPALEGVYLYADYCSGEIFGLRLNPDGTSEAGTLSIDRPVGNVVAFGQDTDGEVYVLEQGGPISRIVMSGSTSTIDVVGDNG